jgi:nucleotide-binding universal stress UspA family protein
MFARILLAVDQSEHSKKAAEVVAGLAADGRAEVVVLHVRTVAWPQSRVEGVDADDAQALVDRVVAELSKTGVRVEGKVRATPSGSPSRTIIDEAKAGNADLITLGSRGLSELEGLLVGSTAHQVIHFADCPVLVVR